ncbi:glutamate racemase [Patescibacteria group bacterium]|nr:glutamate racemase [Patescibacteria group bacterium]
MIGLFDSGYGGLTVLKPLLEKLPQYDYIYLGDNARAPYGSRTVETVKKYSEQAIEYLFAHGAALVLVACNTATATSIRHLQQKYLRDPNINDKKILGVVKPLVEFAVQNTRCNRVSIVGTKNTILSNSYDIEIKNLNSNIEVFSQSCPLLVPFIEENWHKKPEAKSILKKYLRQLKSKNTDVMILGCTHYPLMHRDFVRYMGKKVKVPHPGEVVADSLVDYLERHPEIEKLLSQNGKREYLTTDCADRFKEFGNQNLSLGIDTVKKVQL